VDAKGQTIGEVTAPAPAAEKPAKPEPKPESAPEPEPIEEVRRDPKVAQAIRARREAERQQQKKRRTLGIWGGIAASYVLVLAMALLFRVQVVKIWPQTASAYASIGAKVNLYGLEVHDITAVRKIEAGANVLQISAKVVNVSKKPQPVPFLQVSLLDSHGKEVFKWNVEPELTQLDVSLEMPFQTEIRDAPPEGLSVEINFVEEMASSSTDTAPKSHAPEAHPAAAEPHTSGH
jgi:uncharacterized membrane protein